MTHNRRNPNPRDRDLEAFARQPKPSLKWSPGERHRWRAVDRSLRAAFEPRTRDAEELRWFFTHGPRPKFRGWSDEQKKKWRRVERCLDGGGYNIQRHYTGQPTDGLELAAEYRRYLQNTAKSYAAGHWAPYLTVSARALAALVEKAKPGHKIVAERTREGGTRLAQRARANYDPLFVSDVLRTIPASTFGDLRIDADSARLILEICRALSFAEGEQMPDSAVLALLLEKLEALPIFVVERLCDERGVPRPPEIEERKLSARNEQKLKRQIQMDLLDFAEASAPPPMRGNAPGAELLAFLRSEIRWDLTKITLDPESPTATVAEIAKWAQLDTKWVRRTLAKHGCAAVAKKRQPIETAWLKSERGRDFWIDAEAELRKRQAADLLAGGTRFRAL